MQHINLQIKDTRYLIGGPSASLLYKQKIASSARLSQPFIYAWKVRKATLIFAYQTLNFYDRWTPQPRREILEYFLEFLDAIGPIWGVL